MEIRELFYNDLEEASEVLWKSFYAAEKKNTSMSGMEFFRDLISPVSLSMNTFDGSIVLYGAFCEGKMVSVGALKEKNTILMLYVRPEFWHQGIGGEMLTFLEEQCSPGKICLNASDCAVDFYVKRGYQVISPRKIENELIFTPMTKEKGAE
ncbi:MAG: GNAT family N-acetyltransferase [Clostridia bacterium]|nr:GNAT family N-acetyltransferase [Clostridia bacterium]